jgi:Ca2+-transporting ATPase
MLSADDVACELHVRVEYGLENTEVAQRARLYGANRLPEQPRRPAWLRLFDQFRSLLIVVLLVGAGLAAAVGKFKDASVILAVVLLNAALGFYQEYRAERSLAALKGMLPLAARVRREGRIVETPAHDVVPGDVVLLEAGERVPADGRLFVANSLAIDESTLTGESNSVGKDATAIAPLDAPLAERANMAFMNTLVTRGRGELVITSIGAATAVGRISAELVGTRETPSPLQVQLDVLGKRLGAIALCLVGLLGFLEFLRSDDVTHALLDVVALAVAAVPEGLPAVVTVTLAIGMRRMARQRAIVKKLASVETLGCTTVICSDKTGTLTLNQMTVRALFCRGHRYVVSGEGYDVRGEIEREDKSLGSEDLAPLLTPIALCNDSQVKDGVVIGDPMEGALLVLAAKGGLSVDGERTRLPRIAEVPFDAAHKFMATFHRKGSQILLYVKGAPDVLLARCTDELTEHGVAPLAATALAHIQDNYSEFASRGLRGLLVAVRTIPEGSFEHLADLHACVTNLTFVGLVGLMDPPRPEAREAIELAVSAGIEVKMITGDHKDTALAIARELGLKGEAITGAELDALDALDLADRIEKITVFARVAPEHKVKIVRALQAKGHVVAMTGDGVNDAPALKFADIGIAMGISGTAVSKEAASMVLTDDNFATIVSAIRQGRALYDNILKFVRFQLSTTVGAILTVFFAPLAGLPEPFTPLQILWVAMIMDGPPAVSLAMDAARPGLMEEPPRPRDEPILPLPRVVKIIMFGVTMMVGTLAILYYGLKTGIESRALTLAFTTFVLFQFFNVFNARVKEGSAFNRRFFDNPLLWGSLATVLMLQLLVMSWPPAQGVFNVTALSLVDWMLATAVASSVLLLEEARKLALRILRALGASHLLSRSKRASADASLD